MSKYSVVIFVRKFFFFSLVEKLRENNRFVRPKSLFRTHFEGAQGGKHGFSDTAIKAEHGPAGLLVFRPVKRVGDFNSCETRPSFPTGKIARHRARDEHTILYVQTARFLRSNFSGARDNMSAVLLFFRLGKKNEKKTYKTMRKNPVGRTKRIYTTDDRTPFYRLAHSPPAQSARDFIRLMCAYVSYIMHNSYCVR